MTLQKRYFFEKIIKSMNGIIGMYAQVLKSTTSHGQVEGNKNVQSRFFEEFFLYTLFSIRTQ